ncbi:MAG: hypothetical protein JWP97_4853 [Labilithrix sp.]|nr:hypothetical protein [Labilithrix sp.]
MSRRRTASFLPALALAVLASGAFVATSLPRAAEASVSIAVGYDQLVKDADAVVVMTPLESKSVWEDGRIYTYTRLKVEQGVAGDLGTGSEGWVRTMGGVVGKIGQMVDGEPVFTTGKSSLLFLRKFQASGTYEVSARAQGQYPIVVSADNRTRKVMRSGAVGVLYPPKAPVVVATGASPRSVATATPSDSTSAVRLASEAIHDRPFDDVAREIAASWRTLHKTK